MTVMVKQVPTFSKQEMRMTYNDTMVDLAKKDKNIVLLEADLMGAIKTGGFKKLYPKRFIDVGIMEQNMMGMAAGMSLRGLKPFVHTFGAFATRRAFDQVYLSLGYANLSATIIGSDAGISASHNGGTHMPFSDLGLMRLIPNATVMEMSDHIMFRNILEQLKDKYGLHYIRIVRKNMMQLYEEGSTFQIGKANVINEGHDVTIVASGIMVYEAFQAASELKKEGIICSVLDMFTIQPIDHETLKKYAQKSKLIVTAENHNVTGGLGAAVLESLANNPVKLVQIGIQHRFGQVGPEDFLKKEYNITKNDIINVIKENL
jgi:transketolase